jgi:hypothetical protein
VGTGELGLRIIALRFNLIKPSPMRLAQLSPILLLLQFRWMILPMSLNVPLNLCDQ